MIISCLKNFHQKTLFSEVIKSLINRMFYTISIKKCLRKNFKKKKSVYENFLDTFKAILNKYALLKEKMVRGNIVPFMTKKLKKAITNRPRIKKSINIGPLQGPLYFFFILHLLIIAFLNSFVINGALFPLTIFSFRSACAQLFLYKIFP